MTIHRIPLPADTPSFLLRTALDGTDYILSFDYNGRQDRWYISIADADGDPIVNGLLLATERPLFNRYNDTRLPPGVLAAVDLTENGEDPGYLDLFGRIRLTYYDADEL